MWCGLPLHFSFASKVSWTCTALSVNVKSLYSSFGGCSFRSTSNYSHLLVTFDYSNARHRHYGELPAFPVHNQALLGVAWIPLSSFLFSHISHHLNFMSSYPLSSCLQGFANVLQLGALGSHTLVPCSQPETNLVDYVSTLRVWCREIPSIQLVQDVENNTLEICSISVVVSL